MMSNASADPRAMMVHSHNTLSTYGTVMSSGWFYSIAFLAVSVNQQVFKVDISWSEIVVLFDGAINHFSCYCLSSWCGPLLIVQMHHFDIALRIITWLILSLILRSIICTLRSNNIIFFFILLDLNQSLPYKVVISEDQAYLTVVIAYSDFVSLYVVLFEYLVFKLSGYVARVSRKW